MVGFPNKGRSQQGSGTGCTFSGGSSEVITHHRVNAGDRMMAVARKGHVHEGCITVATFGPEASKHFINC